MLRIITLALLASLAFAGSNISYGNNRIIGGQTADPGEYPSQGSLTYLGDHTCGCSIINEKYVLTAAHCVQVLIVSSLSVHVGSNHINSGMLIYQVGRVHFHESYDINDMSSPDIAVVNIRDLFEMGDLIMPVVLPTQDVATPADTAATAVGWGFTADVGPISPNLLEVELTVRDHAECATIYAADVTLTDAQICADVPEGGKGVCMGDSGGPLFVDGEIHGIFSWSSNGCAVEGFPAVYTRVASFRDWIDTNTVIEP